MLEPQLTVLPQRTANGLMRLAGFFPSVPLQVNFDLLFAPVEGRWRLFGISLNLGQSGPMAPADPPPPEIVKPEARKLADPPTTQAGAAAKPPPARPAPRPLAPSPSLPSSPQPPRP